MVWNELRVILPFDGVLRIDGRESRVVADVDPFEHSWEVSAKFKDEDDVRCVAGRFATSSESVALERG
jgi:hypothetical protein